MSLTTTTPSKNGGTTTTSTTPSINGGTTTPTTTPSINSGTTINTTTPSINGGTTITTTTPSINGGTTINTTTPSINGGTTTTTTTPSIIGGTTINTTTPSINGGTTITTTTPSINGGTTITPNTPNTNGVTVNHVNGDKEEPETREQKKKLSCITKASGFIIWALERAFFNVGHFVGQHPIFTIVVSVIMCGLCGVGLKTFHETQEQEKLWVPQSSRLINEKAWVDRTFPQETRFVSYLAVQPGGDILTPEFINGLLNYYLASEGIVVNGRKLGDICVRVGPFCYVSSLLEFWAYNENIIRGLSKADIIDKINKTTTGPMTGVTIENLLGGKFVTDESGKIVGAEATLMTWVLVKEEDTSDSAAWEKKMIDFAQKGMPGINKTMVYASRSFDDEGFGAINKDIKLLAMGFIIVFVFVVLSLGKFDLLHQKIYVSLVGMVCIGLSILVAYGLATAMGILYSPIQSMLPFLLLGVGVDDMFVIIETWKNLSPEEQKLDIPNKLALTLSSAGVSVTVTSVTDIMAFGIGATTVIPALSSFCIYASIGIFALFFLVSTLFAAALALDERRRRAGRDACICCYRHPELYTYNKCSSSNSFLQIFFVKFYGPFLMKFPVKVIIILLTLAITGLGLWRAIQMRQDFDLINYIPKDSYAYSYTRGKQFYFNRQGMETNIYCGGFDYFKERETLKQMMDQISKSDKIEAGTINSWFLAYHSYLQQSGLNISNAGEYNENLFHFLQSPSGQRLTSYVKFNSTKPPLSIVASYMTMTHTRQLDSQHDVSAMGALREIIDSSNLPTFHGKDMPNKMCFAYSRDYMTCETNKVLLSELYRNLGLSAACVFAVTIILIANLWTSFLVFVCVVFTVIDVCGVLEIWGTTIDTASSILLTLSVGLAVDYSAHIGHTFMTIKGSRNNRALVTLKHIGPAVFNGGFSTFLAFVLLADSSSFGFQMFFRIFSTVVVFGLYHGLAFLPVILSLFGPGAYRHAGEIPVGINLSTDGNTPDPNERQMDDKILNSNGQIKSKEFEYTGPIHTLYKDSDDTEFDQTKPHINTHEIPDLSKHSVAVVRSTKEGSRMPGLPEILSSDATIAWTRF